ncbi:MAG: class I SAM-dependent methyltransferase, partial [Burkholderiales bacterium]
MGRLVRALRFVKKHGVLFSAKIVAQKLLGPLYTGVTLSRIADLVSRNNIPEYMVRLCPVEMNQAWGARVTPMERLAREALAGPFTALEIGTWFGGGSTQVWGKCLKPGSLLMLCDPWSRYLSEGDANAIPAYSLMNNLYHVAINSTLKKVYELERTTGGEIVVIRGKAARVMTHLKPQTFDFIYIDGSHYYEDVRRDIALSKTLIKDGGCICGDDLEVALSAPEIEALAWKNIDKDFIYATLADGSPVNFHPGVALAVAKEIGTVNQEHGFWWV